MVACRTQSHKALSLAASILVQKSPVAGDFVGGRTRNVGPLVLCTGLFQRGQCVEELEALVKMHSEHRLKGLKFQNHSHFNTQCQQVQDAP